MWLPQTAMLTEERRRAILRVIEQDGHALVRDLARRFHTSLITIREDLKLLHHQGEVERVHGGALPVTSRALMDSSPQQRRHLHRQETKRIAAAAVQMIGNDQVIILDCATITMEIARHCRCLKGLTIITNALNIGAELVDSPVEVVLTGGVLGKHSFSLLGPLAEETLRKLRADLFFLVPDGFDVPYGLTTPNLLEAGMKRFMAELSRRVVVACDSDKFGKRSLSLIVPTAAIHETITDKNISKRPLIQLREANIEVRLV